MVSRSCDTSTVAFTIEALDPHAWERLRAVRLEALQNTPEAFGSTYEASATWTQVQWQHQTQSFPTFLAVDDAPDDAGRQRDVGMVRFADHASRPEAAYLISMWVAPSARRRGVGRALIETIRNFAIEHGKQTLLLDVREGNAPAIALYEATGFVATGEQLRSPPPNAAIVELEYALQLSP